MKWIADKTTLCVYCECTDKEISRIKKDPNYYLDEIFMKQIMESKGNNAHMVGLNLIGNKKKGMSRIMRAIHSILPLYKSISWWDKDRKHFIIKENILCLQS